MLAASIVIRSESGSPIATPILLEGKKRPPSRRMEVVIGALSDLITIQAANIWSKQLSVGCYDKKNCQKIIKFQRFWKAHSFQTIKDIGPKFWQFQDFSIFHNRIQNFENFTYISIILPMV